MAMLRDEFLELIPTSHLCRICFGEGENLIGIFSSFGTENKFIDILNALEVNVTKADPWSLFVCEECAGRLADFNQLKLLAKETQLKFEAYREQDVATEEVVNKTVALEDPKISFSSRIVFESKEQNDSVLLAAEEEFNNHDDLVDFDSEVEYETADKDCIDKDKTDLAEEVNNSPRSSKPVKISRKTTSLRVERAKEDELLLQVIPLICLDCDKKFEKYDRLMSHSVKYHQKKGSVLCCGRKFNKRYKLVDHARFHLNPDHYACPVCKKQFTAKSYLQYHMAIHIPEEQRQFQCDKCLKRFPNEVRLTAHLRSHVEDLSFSCLDCGKSFKQKVILDNHVKFVHFRARSQICEICAKVFKTKEGFQAHLTEHMDEPPPRLECNICNGKYKNRSSLRRHMQRHTQNSEDRVACEICKREFASRSQLNEHRKYVHAENKLKCTLCEKVFTRPINLKEHMASHTGQVLYTCAYCPKNFNSNSNKYSHQKARHPVEWERAFRQRRMEGIK